jgi:pimeloyl-ACP methyl ester carboxylesterase
VAGLRKLGHVRHPTIMATSYSDIPYADTQASTRFVRLHAAPAETAEPHGTVVILHGGYWKNAYGLDDAYGNAGVGTLAPWFLARGYSAVEVEYRRRDHEGGGWPGTNADVLAAVRHLVSVHAGAADDAARALRLDKLIVIGHSAGGCLALWLAHKLCNGAVPGCSVAAVLAAAPVADLVCAHEMRVSDEGDAVERYMRCVPSDAAGLAAYREASPAALLPLRCATLIVYGDADKDVPPALVQGYAEAAVKASPEFARVVACPGADHFDVVRSDSSAWAQVAAALAALAHDVGAGAPLGEDASRSLLR